MFGDGQHAAKRNVCVVVAVVVVFNTSIVCYLTTIHKPPGMSFIHLCCFGVSGHISRSLVSDIYSFIYLFINSCHF